MKHKRLTCPFTGIDFDCIEDDNGNITASNPILNMPVTMKYDCETHSYTVPAIWFDKLETASYIQAAQNLKVTYQRVVALVKNGMLQSHKLPNGKNVILYADLLEYKQNRKSGRPRKDNVNA